MGKRLTRGGFGEAWALRLLQQDGYEILERNWRYGRLEVDIVARDSNTYVFVEVKLRRDDSFGAPEEAVTPAKLSRLAEAAQRYLEALGKSDADWRIDVVALKMRSGAVDSARLLRGVG